MIRKICNYYHSGKLYFLRRSFVSKGRIERDIDRCLKKTGVEIIFDVGANIGQSAKKYSRCFPTAIIYSFEPATAAFKALNKVSTSYGNVRSFNLALGNRDGSAIMQAAGTRKSNAIIDGNVRIRSSDVGMETVKITTGDAFCDANNIEEISFLKIDTEGYELEVLKGFEYMLKRGRIKIVEVEAGMNKFNKKHVPLLNIQAFLEEYGYCLCWIYEQVHEIFSNPIKPVLRRINAVFLSGECVNENSISVDCGKHMKI